MNAIYTTLILTSRGFSPAVSNGPEPLPLLLVASVFLLTSWIMRRVGAKN